MPIVKDNENDNPSAVLYYIQYIDCGDSSNRLVLPRMMIDTECDETNVAEGIDGSGSQLKKH